MTHRRSTHWLVLFCFGLFTLTSLVAHAQDVPPITTDTQLYDALLNGHMTYEAAGTGGTTDIFVVEYTGFGPEVTNVTDSIGNEKNARISPDGEYISYLGETDPGVWSLFVAEIDGENERQLTPDGVNVVGFPTWSPDSTQIAFSAIWGGDGAPKIFRTNVDGTNQYVLTQGEGFAAVEPDWYGFENGDTRITYIHAENGMLHVYTLDPVLATTQQVSQNTDQKTNPTWLTDQYIVSTERPDENSDAELLRYDAETGENVALTDNAENDCCGLMEVNGTTFVHLGDRDGQRELFRANLDGSNSQNLTEDFDFTIVIFQLLPDGTIIIGYEEDGVRKVGIMGTDGSIFYMQDGANPGFWQSPTVGEA